ncbi:MAG: hypothetical protein NZ601_07210 [candidate division WOR-3 bacterium]|nr:hypothetical protein [candidate division WOR-3 bacterium]MCX7757887.1 hypothetical protein [candidate division WOR-3 bacterium]MDW7987342.1 hypothetical protein [candidate division WOR-3 bacterium]
MNSKARHLTVLGIVVIVILFFVFWGVIFIRFTYYGRIIKNIVSDKVSGKDREAKLLLSQANALTKAFIKNKPQEIYAFFNSSFQEKTPWDSFYNAYQNWLLNRKVIGVRFTYIKRIGRIGHVSSMIRFNDNRERYCYQSWILTNKGWRLVWLTNFLPHSFLDYGETKSYDIQAIKQLALEELFERGKIKLLTRDLKLPKTIFIKSEKSRHTSYYKVPGYTVKELTLEAIKNQVYKTDALYYLEFAALRIIDDIASIYIDIVPLYRGIPNLMRRRGLQLFFVNKAYPKKEPEWIFEEAGAIW